MKRIAIDSNIVDLLAASPGLLNTAKRAHGVGRLLFVVSHVIHDELSETPNQERRMHLLATYEALPKRLVPTRGGAWGISKWAWARYGDGSESGASLEGIVTPNRGRVRDALIATTAAGDADVLVTNDAGLANAARRAGVPCEVWDPEQLVQFLRAVGT